MMDREDLRRTLYSAFELDDSGENRINPELETSVDNVFGAREPGTPDLQDVLNRHENLNTPKRRMLNRLAPYLSAAAVIILVLQIYFQFIMHRSDRAIVKLVDYSGTVSIFQDLGKTPVKPEKGVNMEGIIRVRTEEKSHSVFTLNRTRIRLEASTRFWMLTTSLKSTKYGRSWMTDSHLDAGLARFRVNKGRKPIFLRLHFPEGRLSVTGTRFAVSVRDGVTRIAVERGSVRVRLKKEKQPRDLSAGAGIRIRGNRAVTVPDAAHSPGFRDLFPKSLKQQAKKKTTIRRTPFSERVFMKDGSIITGKILSQGGRTIRIRTAYGIVTVPWSTVRRVAYIK